MIYLDIIKASFLWGKLTWLMSKNAQKSVLRETVAANQRKEIISNKEINK